MQGLASFAFFLAVAGTVIAAPSNVDPNFVRSSENAPLNANDLDAAMKGPLRSTANKLAQRLITPDSANCIAHSGTCKFNRNGPNPCCEGFFCIEFFLTVSIICLCSFVVIELVSPSCRVNVLQFQRKRGRD